MDWWRSPHGQDARDAIAFFLGLGTFLYALTASPDDRVSLILVSAGLMGYGAARWNGRRH